MSLFCKYIVYTVNIQKKPQKPRKIYVGINFLVSLITNQVHHIILYAFMANMKFLNISIQNTISIQKTP